MNQDQQYRVIGKSGPGVQWHGGMLVRCYKYTESDKPFAIQAWRMSQGQLLRERWDAGEVEILEAISPPQAAVAACESWCGLPFGDKRVPCASDHPSMVVESHAMAAVCGESYRIADCPHPAYCTQACLDRAKAAKEDAMKAAWSTATESGMFKCPRCLLLSYPHDVSPACLGQRCVVSKAAKAPECIRSACKAPPVAGGELCAAHAGQVRDIFGTAVTKPSPPAETRLERWRREHKGYSHGTADPRVHDANVAAMMVGIDGPREPYVPPAPLAAWTPRDLDGDIPDAWEPGGARLGR